MVVYGRKERTGWVSKSHERFVAREEAISAAEDDMMAFGTGAVLVTTEGVKHIPLKNLVIWPVGI